MSVGSVVLLAATIIQVAAAIVALWLIRVTGRKWTWSLFAAAIVLMVVRRAVLFFDLLNVGSSWAADPREEFLSLMTSVLILAGLLGIVPVFRKMRRDVQQALSFLEQRVRERTAELAAANEGLQQERYLLHTLMDYLPHKIYFKDLQSRFIRVNQAMARMFDLNDPGQLIGKSDRDFFSAEHATQALADEQDIVRTGHGIVDKVEKETWPDGHETWASTTKLPLLDAQGHIVGTFGISQDITARRRDAAALQAAKEAAEAASRAKSTFLANMSHEIRTPLNAVIGMTELVLKGDLTYQQREYLSTVRDSGAALLSVINDILDFSKIEAEKLMLEREKFHLRDNLGDTMKSFAFRAHQQGLELACEIHRDVPAWVVGDYHRLRQVIVNLVNNAIKFTERGEVVLEVFVEKDGEPGARVRDKGSGMKDEGSGMKDQVRATGSSSLIPHPSSLIPHPSPPASAAPFVTLHFTVSDTGIGIPSEKHGSIFGMFEQADSSTTRRHGGTGLGLAIAARLVKLMDGTIWVESEKGRGSRFHFTARLGRDDSEPPAALDAEPVCLHGMRVLVVDDNATNRRILQEVLSSWLMEPTTVESAQRALDAMEEADRAGRPFPLVITDAHMPDTDGFMFAGEVREHHRDDGPVIMMLTSGDRPCDAAECDRLGISAYLLKPIKQSELLEAIELSLGLLGPRRTVQRKIEVHTPASRPLRILLAEDSLVNQQLALALLQSEGHQVVVANNGLEAVAAVDAAVGKDRFDAVLMDLQMPEMDGLEATKTIRRKELGPRRLPIIAMTAHALAGDRERCLDAGMDGYTAKPVHAEELFAVLAELTVAPAGGGGRPADEADPVDWPAALQYVRSDERLLITIVDTALGEIPELLASVRESVADDDSQALRRAAHTLKGSVRYFGARQLTELAERLEMLGQAGNAQAGHELLTPLGAAVERLMKSLHGRSARSGAAAPLAAAPTNGHPPANRELTV